jgi:hypothetical protein
VKSRFFREECKSTEKVRISLDKRWLEKIYREAGTRKVPALTFGFSTMPDGVPHDWTAIPARQLQVLCNVAAAVLDGNMEDAEEWARQLE